MTYKAVMFDLIGTTVVEARPDVIATCFAQAFQLHGISVTPQFIKANRGKSKLEVISSALSSAQRKELQADVVLSTFENLVEQNLNSFHSAEGALRIFKNLKARAVYLGIGSGMPKNLFQKVLAQVQFPLRLFDFIGSAEEAGRGRPDPAMLQAMLSCLNLAPHQLLKVGDTVADIEEGKNAGVATAAILSGTQEPSIIQASQPTYMLHTLEALTAILGLD